MRCPLLLAMVLAAAPVWAMDIPDLSSIKERASAIKGSVKQANEERKNLPVHANHDSPGDTPGARALLACCRAVGQENTAKDGTKWETYAGTFKGTFQGSTLVPAVGPLCHNWVGPIMNCMSSRQVQTGADVTYRSRPTGWGDAPYHIELATKEHLFILAGFSDNTPPGGFPQHHIVSLCSESAGNCRYLDPRFQGCRLLGDEDSPTVASDYEFKDMALNAAPGAAKMGNNPGFGKKFKDGPEVWKKVLRDHETAAGVLPDDPAPQ